MSAFAVGGSGSTADNPASSPAQTQSVQDSQATPTPEQGERSGPGGREDCPEKDGGGLARGPDRTGRSAGAAGPSAYPGSASTIRNDRLKAVPVHRSQPIRKRDGQQLGSVLAYLGSVVFRRLPLPCNLKVVSCRRR